GRERAILLCCSHATSASASCTSYQFAYRSTKYNTLPPVRRVGRVNRLRSARRRKLDELTCGNLRPCAMPTVFSKSHRVQRVCKNQFDSGASRDDQRAIASSRDSTQSVVPKPLLATY